MNTKLIDKTIEECAELIHILSKIKHHGISSHNPKTGEQNEHLLIEELGDVIACSNLLAGTLDKYQDDLLCARVKSKLEIIKKFINQ